MNTATIIFSVEEIAALVQVASQLNTLLTKIKADAPDAWSAVQSDFVAADAAWKAPAAVLDIVQGAVPGGQPGITDAEPAALVASPVDTPAKAAEGASYSDASALGVGEHVQEGEALKEDPDADPGHP